MVEFETGLEPMSVLVTGASSQIGVFLLPKLVARGLRVHAISREAPADAVAGVTWHLGDIGAGEMPCIQLDCLIHLAPLPLLPRILLALAEREEPQRCVKRLIAFGSTSRISKQHSSDQSERELARQLDEAEKFIADFCALREIPWTVFRPTLIYGCGRDKNITVITGFIRRFGFFPLIGDARGLRQPVHADDLAGACLAALENPLAFNRAYDLSGGETLNYRQMVERVFAAEGKHTRFVRIPLPLFRVALTCLSLLPSFRYLSGAMANRMAEDLCFDHWAASRDFGYAPRKFLQPPQNTGFQPGR